MAPLKISLKYKPKKLFYIIIYNNNIQLIISPFFLQPGQHALELNPYWKSGGAGLPGAPNKTSTGSATTKTTSNAEPANVKIAGDGGLAWIRKAMERCEEQAEEQGITKEEIAAMRYGVSGNSVIFYSMLFILKYDNSRWCRVRGICLYI